MSASREYSNVPVAAKDNQPARYFAGSYAGEHVAGTEFVIGAAFVAWGTAAADVVIGLLIGNTLAVLMWRFVCAPIAVDTRLTLYAFLRKVAGKQFVRVYSVINGVLFAILAGSMITVSASAVRIPLGIPAQVNWYPTSIAFVLVAIAVGSVVVTLAVMGFKRLAQFASLVAPWMIAMFLVGALAILPALAATTGMSGGLASLSDFWTIAESKVWVGSADSTFTMYHVAAFAWVANLAMHGSLGDMTLLRFAKRASYGYFSALGMFIGHFVAWIAAGVMGAGAAVVLNTSIEKLDAGEVAFQSLGVVGIVAVIIAGWTTSNPTLYRAGLAFQSLNDKWSRRRVTLLVGVATTLIACFPFVFTKLLSFVGLMGLLLAPVGAVLITDYWIFPRIGLTRFWSHYRQSPFNIAAMTSWIVGLLAAFALSYFGDVHVFFLLVPTWLVATVTYIFSAKALGAGDSYVEQVDAENRQYAKRLSEEKRQLLDDAADRRPSEGSGLRVILVTISAVSLVASLVLSVLPVLGDFESWQETHNNLKEYLAIATVVFFVATIAGVVQKGD